MLKLLIYLLKMRQEQIDYIRTNIISINAPRYSLDDIGKVLFNSETDLKVILNQYFIERLVDDSEFKQNLINEFIDNNYVKSRIKNIANNHLILESDLKNFFSEYFQYSLKDLIDKSLYVENSLTFISEKVNNSHHYAYLKNSLKKILEKQYDFVFTNGFPSNILNINSGVMTANAGDSAQFLFIARAILAGYNCSNVDVRSSRYDAVIDYKNTLLRVQIKGISSGASVSFKDRDRGGQGIDHTHTRNIGQRITSEHCDIYVAVDKQVGVCYLIPMSYVDSLNDQEIRNVNLSTLQVYKENWGIIAEIAEAKL